MNEARKQTTAMEVGEVSEYVGKKVIELIEEAIQMQADEGKFYTIYYIWHRYRKDPYANNTIHIYPMNRMTRPSPYQDPNHALWSVRNMNEVKLEWSVMDQGMRDYVKANPNEFHNDTVKSAHDYSADKLESIDDYIVDGNII